MDTALIGLCLLGRALAADGGFVSFASRQEGERFIVTGENRHPAMPYHATAAFPVLVNLRPSVPLPARVVLAPGSAREVLFLDRVDPSAAARMNATYQIGRGDPGARHDDGVRYLFPWPHGEKHLVGQGYFGAYTHRGRHALDFQMPEGTPVCAAREGVVVETKADSTRGGPGPEFARLANVVAVLHADGTWAEYAHLRFGGVIVAVGERVRAGQVLGYSGTTGQTNGPHLHFAVFKASWEQESGETVSTAFAHLDGAAASPAEGKWYYAVHPGGAPFAPVLAERITDADLDARETPTPLDGRVRFRPETVDDKIYLWCANGLARPQAVTLSFTQLKNLKPSKPVPFTRTVPSGREVFFLTLARTTRSGEAGYRLSSRLRPLP